MANEKAGSAGRLRSAGQIGRDQIARMVVVASFLTVFLLVSTLVALAKFEAGTAASGVAEKAFNAILPVLAGWVGTVLAFYFSSASQEHTTDILDKAMERASSGRTVDGTLASAKMIPRSKILRLRELRDNTNAPDQLLLSTLQSDFDSADAEHRITRLMFLDGEAFKYVLHVGTLNKFIARPSAGTLESRPLTFGDLLKDQAIATEISTLVAFVSVASTLAEAKAALDKVPGAQDIIITATGNPTEPVIGWLTNVDLTKALTVS